MSVLAREVADRVSKLRSDRNLRQKEVADRIGCSPGHISHVETGYNEYEYSLTEVERLASCFGVHPLSILAGLSDDEAKLVERLSRMDPQRRQLALKLFSSNLEIVEVLKNWPVNHPGNR